MVPIIYNHDWPRADSHKKLFKYAFFSYTESKFDLCLKTLWTASSYRTEVAVGLSFLSYTTSVKCDVLRPMNFTAD